MSGYPTLLEVKEFLGVTGTTDDVWLTAAMGAVITAVENYCQRKFALQPDVAKWVKVMHRVQFWVYRYPIVSVQQVTVNGDTKDISKISINEAQGEIFLNFPVDGDVEIQFTGGYDPIPDDVMFVILQSIKDAYAGKEVAAGTGGIKSHRVDGVATISYFESGKTEDSSGGGAANAPPLISAHALMLDAYLSDASIGAVI